MIEKIYVLISWFSLIIPFFAFENLRQNKSPSCVFLTLSQVRFIVPIVLVPKNQGKAPVFVLKSLTDDKLHVSSAFFLSRFVCEKKKYVNCSRFSLKYYRYLHHACSFLLRFTTQETTVFPPRQSILHPGQEAPIEIHESFA